MAYQDCQLCIKRQDGKVEQKLQYQNITNTWFLFLGLKYVTSMKNNFWKKTLKIN